MPTPTDRAAMHAPGPPGATSAGDSPPPPTRPPWWRRLRRHRWGGHALAIALFLLALAGRFALRPVLPPGYPFLTFFPAVLFSTFLGGRGPGALCAVLSLLASWYWFIPPIDSFGLDGASSLALLFFGTISAVDVLVIDAVLRKQDQLEAEQARTAALLEQRNTLFSELQHRVANNMLMVSAVLSSQQRRLAHNDEAVQALREARAHFETGARVHRRLHDPALQGDDFACFLDELCQDAMRLGERPVVLQTDIAAIPMSTEARTSVALLVTELITNALKHAFDGSPGERIDVTLRPSRDGGFVLRVADNGRGLPEGFDPMRSERLGMRIVQSMVRGLDGHWRTTSGADGTRFELTVDARHVAQPPAARRAD